MNTNSIDLIMKYPYVAIYTASHVGKALSLGVSPAKLTNTIEGLKRLGETKLDAKINTNTVTFNYKGRNLVFNFKTDDDLRYTLFEIYEQFYEESYGIVKPDGKSVVDIGAAYGDTPIYFAINGATSVMGYEPSIGRYNMAQLNIKSNGLSDKITIKNESVPNLSELPNADILKIDCEGCEYSLLKAGAGLAKFKEVIMEYHSGYSNLVAVLESEGFEVENRYRPYYNIQERKIIDTGMIYAHSK